MNTEGIFSLNPHVTRVHEWIKSNPSTKNSAADMMSLMKTWMCFEELHGKTFCGVCIHKIRAAQSKNSLSIDLLLYLGDFGTHKLKKIPWKVIAMCSSNGFAEGRIEKEYNQSMSAFSEACRTAHSKANIFAENSSCMISRGPPSLTHKQWLTHVQHPELVWETCVSTILYISPDPPHLTHTPEKVRWKIVLKDPRETMQLTWNTTCTGSPAQW